MPKGMLRPAIPQTSLWVLGLALALQFGATGQNTQVAGPAWMVPADIFCPLEQVMDKGLLPVVGNTQGARGGTLAVIDLKAGKTAWQLEAPASVKAMNVWGDVLVVGYSSQTAVAYGLQDGEELWQLDVQGNFQAGQALGAHFSQLQWFQDVHTSPQGVGGVFLVYRDKIYFTARGTLHCVNPEDGNIEWQADVGITMTHHLVAAAGTLVVMTLTETMGINAETGEKKWTIPEHGRGPIFTIGDDLYICFEKTLDYVDTQTGESVWTVDLAGKSDANLHKLGKRLVFERSHDVAVIDAQSGKVLGFTKVLGQPGIGDDELVYRAEPRGPVCCVDVAKMNLRWQQPCEARDLARIMVRGDAVVGIGSDTMFALNAGDGSERWTSAAPAFGGFSRTLRAIDDRAVYTLTGQSVVGVALDSGAVTLATPPGFLFADWMLSHGGNLYLHYGMSKGIAAFPLAKPPEDGEE